MLVEKNFVIFKYVIDMAHDENTLKHPIVLRCLYYPLMSIFMTRNYPNYHIHRINDSKIVIYINSWLNYSSLCLQVSKGI